MDKIEKQWDQFGAKNPYFAVATFDKFNKENLNETALEEFFSSGEEYTERIWSEIESNYLPDFKPERALDFGCGVGRLTIPIAKRSGEAVGVDISQKMLDEAKLNAARLHVENIEFVKGDNELSQVTGKFDFVHSFIVIQHIKPKLGERIFENLIGHLSEKGIGALHITYDHPGSFAAVFRFKLYRTFPFIYSLRNFVLNKKKEPLIPIYTYDLNRIFDILYSNGCHKCVVRFSEHGHKGVLIIFEKKAEKLY